AVDRCGVHSFPTTTLFRSSLEAVGDQPERYTGHIANSSHFEDIPVFSFSEEDTMSHSPRTGNNESKKPKNRTITSISVLFVSSRSEEHTSELQSRENLVCR